MIALKWKRALLAGLAGAFVALLLLLAAWWLLRFDFIAGDALRGALPTFSWLRLGAAAAVALAGGPFVALSYAIVFEYITRRSGWVLGAAMGIVHALIVWLGCGLVPWLFPRVAASFADAFGLLFFGAPIMIAFGLAHICYGTIVGGLYGEPLHPFESEPAVNWRQVYSRDAPIAAD